MSKIDYQKLREIAEKTKIAGDAQLSTPCTDSIINSIATGIRIKGE